MIPFSHVSVWTKCQRPVRHYKIQHSLPSNLETRLAVVFKSWKKFKRKCKNNFVR